MQSIGSRSLFSVTRVGLLGEGSIESLGDLYLPLLGANSLGLYYALYAFGEKDELAEFQTFAEASRLPYAEFEEAKKPLEALGLLRTFFQEDDGAKVYSFFLYRPRSPFSFFDNVLLSGLLRERVGETRYAALKQRYEIKKPQPGAKNISTPFREVFSPETKEKSALYASSQFEAVGRGPASLDLGFDSSAFLEAFKKKGLSEGALSQEEISLAARYGALYGYPSDVMGDFAADATHMKEPFGTRLSKSNLESLCRSHMDLRYLHKAPGKSALGKSETVLAKKIAMMDTCAPAKYLQLKQSGHQPATSDLKLIEKLTIDMGLPGPATNALMDYILEKNGNVLSAPLAEKIGASLVRAGVDNARDAMEMLKANSHHSSKAKISQQTKEAEQVVTNKAAEEEALPSDEELDALFDEAYAK